ncbi:MAG: hypothetical protein O3A00_29360, partial [Planctomycetota bacterium]|nr:hypothetical protein [Planctomycetota bacterium]
EAVGLQLVGESFREQAARIEQISRSRLADRKRDIGLKVGRSCALRGEIENSRKASALVDLARMLFNLIAFADID